MKKKANIGQVGIGQAGIGQAGLAFDAGFFHPGDRVGVAVSGGADSVALLCALHAANRRDRNALGIGLSVVHVHHGIRGIAADEDESFVEELAARLELPLHLRNADAPGRAEVEKETLEEAARNIRYGYFRELISSGELDVVPTAHTLEDQAETVLMKLLRGAWTEGLSGIYPVLEVLAGGRAGRVVRPMLAVRRAEVEAYLQSLGQTWRDDATNTDLAHTRNRVRHELMPALREFNPNVQGALAHVAELAREEEARWKRELARIVPQVVLPGRPVRGGGRAVSTLAEEAAVAMELESLRRMDVALRRRVLRAAAAQLGCQPGFEHTERLMALCGSSSAPEARATGGRIGGRIGRGLDLPGGLRAERTARELQLSRTAGVADERRP